MLRSSEHTANTNNKPWFVPNVSVQILARVKLTRDLLSRGTWNDVAGRLWTPGPRAWHLCSIWTLQWTGNRSWVNLASCPKLAGRGSSGIETGWMSMKTIKRKGILFFFHTRPPTNIALSGCLSEECHFLRASILLSSIWLHLNHRVFGGSFLLQSSHQCHWGVF